MLNNAVALMEAMGASIPLFAQINSENTTISMKLKSE